STFLGTSLLRDSTDPTRTMQTAAALVSSPDAAARTAREIGGDIDQRAVQASISVQPLGESNVLSVTATCKGKGCPFKRKQFKVVSGVANLSALFAKHQLGAGVLIELKVTAPGMTGETIDVKTRAGKAPKVTTS
ncbi:MAG: hypothetical protein ACTHK3_08325, partial [Solirubrobacterales bacterium]